MDSLVCMGASIGMGLGLRHVLPEAEARRVVSVIGDSTFVHSGITGLVEMVYNPPATGHVVLILDNGTTAMTGLQEHPGTGRTLDHRPTGPGRFRGPRPPLGIANVTRRRSHGRREAFRAASDDSLPRGELTVHDCPPPLPVGGRQDQTVSKGSWKRITGGLSHLAWSIRQLGCKWQELVPRLCQPCCKEPGLPNFSTADTAVAHDE